MTWKTAILAFARKTENKRIGRRERDKTSSATQTILGMQASDCVVGKRKSISLSDWFLIKTEGNGCNDFRLN